MGRKETFQSNNDEAAILKDLSELENKQPSTVVPSQGKPQESINKNIESGGLLSKKRKNIADQESQLLSTSNKVRKNISEDGNSSESNISSERGDWNFKNNSPITTPFRGQVVLEAGGTPHYVSPNVYGHMNSYRNESNSSSQSGEKTQRATDRETIGHLFYHSTPKAIKTKERSEPSDFLRRGLPLEKHTRREERNGHHQQDRTSISNEIRACLHEYCGPIVSELQTLKEAIKHYERDPECVPRNNNGRMNYKGISLETIPFLQAGIAKTMRKRVNKIIMAMWTPGQRDRLILRKNKRFPLALVISLQDENNINLLCKSLQKIKKLSTHGIYGKHKKYLNQWIADFLKNDKSRRAKAKREMSNARFLGRLNQTCFI